MKKLIDVSPIYVIIALVVGIGIGISFNLGKISAAENTPGSIGDPLASKSYIDAKLDTHMIEVQEQITSTLEAKLTELPAVTDTNQEVEGETETSDTSESPTDTSIGMGDDAPYMAVYEVIKLTKGQRLILDESAEMILRSGEATAIANVFGNGLTDVTAGIDVGQDETVEWNHLLIAPRPDGRGITVTSIDAYIMVKGQYEIFE